MVQRNLWQTVFKKSEVVCSAYDRPYHFNFFKGYLPQISFLNTFSKKSGIFFFFFFQQTFHCLEKYHQGLLEVFFKKSCIIDLDCFIVSGPGTNALEETMLKN